MTLTRACDACDAETVARQHEDDKRWTPGDTERRAPIRDRLIGRSGLLVSLSGQRRSAMVRPAALRAVLAILAAVVPTTNSYAYYMVSSHCDQSMVVGSTIMGELRKL